jgi:hypothetical protein
VHLTLISNGHLPSGLPPYIANEAPKGTEHSLLENESKRLWHFVEGADADTTKTKRDHVYSNA